ncbi:MAG: PilN domain-containing protein [Pirellulales bacterium]|nr:PilN domain-containing protein [Pirellulales bacterium]
MKRKSNKSLARSVAIEVCHSTLHAVVCDQRDDQRREARTHAVNWRQAARNLHDPAAAGELAAALKRLAAEWKLGHAALQIVLSPDHCVTRVSIGKAEEVRQELRELEERCHSYLLLGGGPKSLGGCVRQVDAKVQHALLAVANQRALSNLVDAAAEAGLKIDIVEPGLVAVCRLIGKLGLDATGPGLVVQLSERGAEVGLSYQGQLLIEYRPVARTSHEQLPDIVAGHLGRLQRYCDRYVRFAAGPIGRIILCGNRQAIEAVRAGFADRMKLPVDVLDAPQGNTTWEFTGPRPGPEFCAALGACLRVVEPDQTAEAPNLLARLRAQTREPIMPLVTKTFWPVAAALVIGAASWGGTWWQQHECSLLEAAVEKFEPQRRQASLLRRKSVCDLEKTELLAALSKAIQRPAWDQISATIARCLPEDVWLDAVLADGEGHLRLQGASHTNDGVYEFVRWLQQYPSLAQVAVNGTRTIQETHGPVTQFEISCDLAGYGGVAGDGHGKP